MFKKYRDQDEDYGLEDQDHHNPDINVSYAF